MPPSGFVLCVEECVVRGSFVESRVAALRVVGNPNQSLNHAFSLEPVLQFVQIDGLL